MIPKVFVDYLNLTYIFRPFPWTASESQEFINQNSSLYAAERSLDGAWMHIERGEKALEGGKWM